PLMFNGKINRNALPQPDAPHPQEYTPPRDALEEQLVEIWSQVLELEIPIGIHDNFFELGGHSLKATKMTTRIQEEIGTRVPLVELFSTPTPAEIAGYIRRVKQTQIREELKDINLVSLKWNSHNARNLFFVHDGTGEVEAYIQFCNHLNGKFNCWGIRADRLTNYTPRNLHVPQVARQYIRTIKKVQPHGPYDIVGYCTGGNIAFEIAAQLETQEKIEFLALVDSPPPQPEPRQSPPPVTIESESNFMMEFLQHYEIKSLPHQNIEIERIWPSLIDHLITSGFSIEKARERFPSHWADGIPNFRQLSLDQLIYYMNVIRTFFNASLFYVPPRKLTTDVHYFVPTQSQIENKDLWANHCNHPLTFHQINGNHTSIFKVPQVADFSGAFSRLIP
ncbi:MAG: hypothetical protein GY940_00025, partial [bacterium]|nr:hypothetical protein [bacterium]